MNRQQISSRVSVAIITYNSEKFVVKAIDSALAQDYPNIEIIISDDASTDSTLTQVKKYVAKYPGKIRLLTSKKNKGAVENWFKCVLACRGKYVTGLAGDDELYPNAISKQVAVMENNSEIAICYADVSVFHVPSGKEIYRLSQKAPAKSGGVEIALADSIYYSPTMMFLNKFAPKENSFKEIRHAADLAFYKEIMILSAPKGKIYYLPEILYKYQKHDSNITVTGFEYHKEHIESIKLLKIKYPKYSSCLNPSIYDFCCVAFFKNIIKFKYRNAGYFLYEGFCAAGGNPFKLFRALIWGVKFYFKKCFELKR